MKKFTFLFAMIAATLVSCNQEKECEDLIEYGFPSLVDVYYIPNGINVKSCGVDSDSDIGNYIVLDCMPDEKPFKFDPEVNLPAFKQYASFYGDTIFSNIHTISALNYASVMPLISINVKTDKQFDEKHPANSSINDLVYLYEFRDLKTEIYVKKNNLPKEGKYYIELQRSLDSISEEEPLYMLNEWFRLHFKKLPDIYGTYNLTISMKFGADPITGETVDLEPIVVKFDFN
ncbi:MAG: hypothetical protein IKO99_05485 [Bacteroidales bacterium]|nr:hypothetical protein [Bacteroidales bacterium]